MICVVEVTQIKALISLIQFHVYTQGDTIIMYIYVHMYMYMYIHIIIQTNTYIHVHNACLCIHYIIYKLYVI